jgi:hypothetical protein
MVCVVTWPIPADEVAFWYASLTPSADHGNLPSCTGFAALPKIV